MDIPEIEKILGRPLTTIGGWYNTVQHFAGEREAAADREDGNFDFEFRLLPNGVAI